MLDPRASRELALKARSNGGNAISLSETQWDVSGRCERPKRVTVQSRDYAEFQYDPFWKEYLREGWFRGNPHPVQVPGIGRSHETHLEVRCGRCAPCLRARAFQWKERAKTECARLETRRTWFVTLTANPTTQLRWSGDAARRLRQGGTDPTSLSDDEWYAERCKEAGRELTKYVKRVRKNSQARLRTLWVFERHEGGGPHDGLPHVHGLVHEMVAPAAVNYRTLRSEWVHGYSTAKLLTHGSESDSDTVAAYVSKCCGYIAKATTVRIRASRFYGAPELPQHETRAKRIAAAAAGGGGVDELPKTGEGTTPTRDVGTHPRARSASTGHPAVERGPGERGENPSPLASEARETCYRNSLRERVAEPSDYEKAKAKTWGVS